MSTANSINESILITVKRMLIGIGEDDPNFDAILIPYINSALMHAAVVGCGKRGFAISGETETWEDFIGPDYKEWELVKNYVSLKVRLLFDPPTVGSAVEALNKEVEHAEWVLNTLELVSHASSSTSDSEDTEESD